MEWARSPPACDRTLVYALLTGLLVGTYATVALLPGQLAGDTAHRGH